MKGGKMCWLISHSKITTTKKIHTNPLFLDLYFTWPSLMSSSSHSSVFCSGPAPKVDRERWRVKILYWPFAGGSKPVITATLAAPTKEERMELGRWLTPAILALLRLMQEDLLCVWCLLRLPGECQIRLGCTVRPCVKQTNKKGRKESIFDAFQAWKTHTVGCLHGLRKKKQQSMGRIQPSRRKACSQLLLPLCCLLLVGGVHFQSIWYWGEPYFWKVTRSDIYEFKNAKQRLFPTTISHSKGRGMKVERACIDVCPV